jgi:hypothetical protein
MASPRPGAKHPLHRWREIRRRKGWRLWLLDEIALAQRFEKSVAAEEFQLRKLTVKPDHTAVLACEDGNGEAVLSREIPFTDFPLDEIKFYCTNNTILLPSEY